MLNYPPSPEIWPIIWRRASPQDTRAVCSSAASNYFVSVSNSLTDTEGLFTASLARNPNERVLTKEVGLEVVSSQHCPPQDVASPDDFLDVVETRTVPLFYHLASNVPLKYDTFAPILMRYATMTQRR